MKVPTLLLLIAGISLVWSSDKVDSENESDDYESDEYGSDEDDDDGDDDNGDDLDIEPWRRKEVARMLEQLIDGNRHTLPPDWSLETDANEKKLYSDENLNHQHTPERENADEYRRPEPNIPEASHLNLKQSLKSWKKVEQKLISLLTSPRYVQRITLKDRSTHTAAVMSSILGLATKLLETCSTIEYIKSYREIVSENLIQAFANPAETTNTLRDLLERIRKTTATAYELVQRNTLPCKQTGYSSRCYSQVNKQKHLIQALGSLASTYLASKSLQSAVSSFDEVAYLLNGQKDQALYVLAVKAAHVLKLLTNSYTCNLPLESQLPRLTDTYDDSLNHVVTLKHRYPLLIG